MVNHIDLSQQLVKHLRPADDLTQSRTLPMHVEDAARVMRCCV